MNKQNPPKGKMMMKKTTGKLPVQSPSRAKSLSAPTGQGMTIKRSTQPIMKAIAKGSVAEGAAEGAQTMALKNTTVKKPQQVLMNKTTKTSSNPAPQQRLMNKTTKK